MRAIAEELAELLTGDVREAAYNLICRDGVALIVKMSDADEEKAMKLLSQTRSQRDRTLSKLSPDSAAAMILRARYFGLCSYRALELADRLTNVVGRSYRDAAVAGAYAAGNLMQLPTFKEILPGFNGVGREMDPEPSYRW